MFTICSMEKAGKNAVTGGARFAPGAIVVVSLHSPREKFWGAILELAPAGLSISGVDLNSFEDFATLVRAGEAESSVVFFPMHRVERIEIDAPSGPIPALQERFAEKSGKSAAAVLGEPTNPEQLALAARKAVLALLAALGDDAGRAAELLGISDSQLRSMLP